MSRNIELDRWFYKNKNTMPSLESYEELAKITDRLDTIAFEVIEERDKMFVLLEEITGTFGDIGTDEPVNGGDTVDFLNEWIPKARKLVEGS